MSRITDELVRKIEKTVELDQRVIVTFKSVTKSTMIGHFVELNDHEELKSKSLTRFVTAGKEEAFGCASDYHRPGFTCLLNINSMLTITIR